MRVAGRSPIIIAEPAEQEQQTAMQDQITTTNTDLDEPRDYCFGGTCATCDGHNGQCTCPCHARAQQQEQMEQQQEQQQEPRTLAEILAARTVEREQAKQEAEDQARRKAEGKRQDEITEFATDLRVALSQDLYDTLGITIHYDEETARQNARFDDHDTTPAYAAFDYDAAQWRVHHEYYHGDWHWTIWGPNTYCALLQSHYSRQSSYEPSLDTTLLDALADYPLWLEDHQRREQEKADTAATKTAEAKATRDAMPIFAYIAGDDPGHHGILHTESKVWIAIATPDTADERLAYERIDRIRAAVVDWDAQWLLINLDDDETQQRLIPITRVVSIQPRV